jgi:hypothetical protein
MAGLPPDPQKKIPLLGVSSKPKKDDRTYVFNLQIGESNEETYPEYSWKDLVTNEKAKQANRERLAAGDYNICILLYIVYTINIIILIILYNGLNN